MLNFDFDKEKCIVFEIVEATNLSKSDIKISVRLNINGVEYCIPGQMVNESIQVDIPALSSILKEADFNEIYTMTVEAIVDDNKYLVPFADQFKITQNTKLEAKLKSRRDAVTEEGKSLDIKLASEDTIREEKKIIEEPKSLVDNFLEI